MTNKKSPLEIEAGSDNVFADLDLGDAAGLSLKAAIAGEINAILGQRHMTEVQASELLGLPQSKISALMNGKLRYLSLEVLFSSMRALDRDVEISFRPTPGGKAARAIIHDEGSGDPAAT